MERKGLRKVNRPPPSFGEIVVFSYYD